MYGWKERIKQTPTFSSSTGRSLGSNWLIPHYLHLQRFSPQHEKTHLLFGRALNLLRQISACSCLRTPSPLFFGSFLEWNLEVTQQWHADPPLCPCPCCNNASCQSRWLTSSWLHHCPCNGLLGTSRSLKKKRQQVFEKKRQIESMGKLYLCLGIKGEFNEGDNEAGTSQCNIHTGDERSDFQFEPLGVSWMRKGEKGRR